MFSRREPFDKIREKMVRDLKGRGISDKRVLKAMAEIPREKFILSRDQQDAYTDGPLSIDCGQTISQPYMVALMSECLELKGNEKVLEIGTGSGYQTAILSILAREVFTIERHSELSRRAMDILAEFDIENVVATAGDGTKGLSDYGPYDGIIVTAGAPDYPRPLKEQLADGGRLVIPIGGHHVQTLKCLTRVGEKYVERNSCDCRFVKLIGEYGWPE